MVAKVTLVGESNPYGDDPDFALYPYPQRSAGYRLCVLVLGMGRAAYLQNFNRINLCNGKWNMKEARATVATLGVGKYVLCGAKVCSAFDIAPFTPFRAELDGRGHNYVTIPHPSGLCRLWNEPGAFMRARSLIVTLYPEIAPLVGKVGT